jgi:hypothetical protein
MALIDAKHMGESYYMGMTVSNCVVIEEMLCLVHKTTNML